MTTDWLLCGWRVQSELPLSYLPAWNGDDRPSDMVNFIVVQEKDRHV